MLSFSSSCVNHRDLHSFPTRRSSDLIGTATGNGEGRSAGRAAWNSASHQNPPARPTTVSTRSEMLLRESVASSVADRKSTRLNSSHRTISYAVFCLKKKTKKLKQN